MDRLENIRHFVDQEINKLHTEEERKFAYIHTYGVAQVAALLASIEKIDIELLCVAAMLHDIAIYITNCPHHEHAVRSAKIAQEVLAETKQYTDDEIILIAHAIAVHSNKMNREDHPFAELLKDSDVLQHYLYNVNIPLDPKEQFRLYYLLEKLEKIRTYQTSLQ